MRLIVKEYNIVKKLASSGFYCAEVVDDHSTPYWVFDMTYGEVNRFLNEHREYVNG